MVANRILHVILTLTSFIVIPVQLITTLILGILVYLTFGLLLLPLSFVWIVFFFGPLLGLSYAYERLPIFRALISLIGVPLAVVGDAYVALIPSMGEMDSRWSKMLYCQTFPYTYEFHRAYAKKQKVGQSLKEVFRRIDPVLQNFVLNLYHEELSANKESYP